MHYIPLRPHHVLCIHFFEGKGYSPAFVENMTSVIHSLSNNSKVKLTVGSDLICSACPKKDDLQCNDNSNANGFDKAVLSVCGLKEGQLLEWQEVRDTVRQIIIKPNDLHNICGDCSWFTICQRKLQEEYLDQRVNNTEIKS